jgi:RHS repeat-associated protein
MQMTTSAYTSSGLQANDVGDKLYELSNHLGNVLQVVSDSRMYMQKLVPTITDRVGISVDDATGAVTRSLTGTGWGQAGGASLEKIYPGGYIEWTLDSSPIADNQLIMLGLSYTNTNANYNTINYCWYVYTDGNTRIYELGSSVPGHAFAYALNDVLKISREGGSIKYYMNGVLKRTVADANPTAPMIVDFSINVMGKKISNLKIANPYYTADVVQQTDYYPYGMVMPNRNGSDNSYRYGFQAQEKDDEVKGAGESVNFKYRMHDPRIGRFFAVDPLAAQYAHNSPYAFSENNVVDCIELEGLEKVSIHTYSFAPFNIFGFFFLGDGMDRKFGNTVYYGESANFRIGAQVNVDLGTGTYTSKSHGAYSTEYGYDDDGAAWVVEHCFSSADVELSNIEIAGNYFGATVMNSGALCAVPDAPDIDVTGAIQMNYSPKKENAGGWLWVAGKITGDRFPSNEWFLKDEYGNKVLLGVSGTDIKYENIGPFTELANPINEKMSQWNFTIEMDGSDRFTAVWFNKTRYSIEEWNTKFTSLSPSDPATNTNVNSTKGTFETIKK